MDRPASAAGLLRPHLRGVLVGLAVLRARPVPDPVLRLRAAGRRAGGHRPHRGPPPGTGSGARGCCAGGSAGGGGRWPSARRWPCWRWPRPRTWRSGGHRPRRRPGWCGRSWRSSSRSGSSTRSTARSARSPGWRGYALVELQDRRSPLAAAAILGVLVAGWHLPLIAAGMLGPVALPVTFVITIVYAWLFRRTGGSVLLTMVFHVAQGTVSYAALGFVGADAVRMDWLVGALWAALALGGRAAGPGGLAGRARPGERAAAGGRRACAEPPARTGPDRPGSDLSGPVRAGLQSTGRAAVGPAAGCRSTSAGRDGWRTGRGTARWSSASCCAGSPRAAARWLWGLLWVAAGLAELAVLAPVVFQRDAPIAAVDVVLRLIGGSFAACGLIAWQRRPDSRSGLLDDGHRLRVPGAGAAAGPRLGGGPDGRALALRRLVAVLHPAAADLPEQRAAAHPGRPAAGRRGRARGGRARAALAGLRRRAGDAADQLPGPRGGRRDRHRAAGALRGHLGRHRRRRRDPLAPRVRTRPAGDAAERGRRGLHAALGDVAHRRPDRARPAVGAAAVGDGLVAGHRPAGVPGRAAPVPAGPRRARRPVRPSCARCSRPQLQSALARVLHDPAFAIAHPDGDGRLVGVDGRPVELPATARGGVGPSGDHGAARRRRRSRR